MKSSGRIPLESEIVRKITSALKAAGAQYIFKMHGESFQASGIPDLIGIAPNGRFFALEVKRPELGRISALQVKAIDKINDAGGFAEVVWDEEQAVAYMRLATQGKPYAVKWEVKPEWLMREIRKTG